MKQVTMAESEYAYFPTVSEKQNVKRVVGYILIHSIHKTVGIK